MINYKHYVAINSEVRFGKATIIGIKINVFDVLNWLANGTTFSKSINDFS
jgi:uncharacterized protein (DUF433 family)